MAGLLRRALSSATSPHDREEQGYPPIEGSATGPASNSERPLTVMTIDQSALIPPEDKLLIFRTLTGIDTVPAVSRAGHAVREGPNVGIYTRVVRAETRAAQLYKYAALLINASLGFQIIIAATLTALGAANASYSAITGLGAMNTIIAGIITYVKGAGLPNKLKYQENEWRKVREYIEQRERELCLADTSIDAYEEVRNVEELYRHVKADLEADKTQGARLDRATVDTRTADDLGPSQSTNQRMSKRPESSATMPIQDKA